MDNTNLAFNYQDLYGQLSEVGGPNPMLLQSFMLSNNADIIKSIEYFKNELNKGNAHKKLHTSRIIARLENIMEQRLLITEDLFAQYLPMMVQGPVKTDSTQQPKAEEQKKEDKKVIEHPASKGKKQQTVNEKIGEQKAQQTKEQIEEEQVEQIVKETSIPSYHDLYRTDEEKIADINDNLIPNLQKYLFGEKQSDNNALRLCRLHFRNFGTTDRFYSDTAMVRFVDWLKSGRFQARNPLDILKGEPLSMTDIIKEAEELIIDGADRKEVRNYLAGEVINTKLKEQKEAISTERDFIKFFQSTLQYLFDEDQLRRLKAKASKSNETRESVKKNLYLVHKEAKSKVTKMAKDFREWLVTQGEKTNINSALAEMLAYIKSADISMYKEYMAKHKKSSRTEESSGESKPEAPKSEVKEESKETNKTDGQKRKADVVASPVVFPKLEESLKYKDKKSLLTEFLQTIANKKVSPIGTKVNGMDAIIADLTKLANKRILEMGLKKEQDGSNYDDWTEQDVSKYMAEEVVPYITEEYGLLRSETEEELTENLQYYLEKFPSGKEKERHEKLKEVFTSEVPRTNYMKKVARQVRKGKMEQINSLVSNLIKANDEKLKETKT